MDKILTKIEEYNKIIIFGHTKPDGDCIGSQYGLMNLIKLNYPNKEVYVSGESDPFSVFIGAPTFIDENLFLGSLGISVDVGVFSRVSDKRIQNCEYKIKIDHHIELKREEFYDESYVDDKAASCTEIIVDFYETFKNKLQMNKIIAQSLYFGLVTDTNSFRHDCVTTKTFKNASILLQYDININEINKAIYSYSLENIKFKGYVLSNFVSTDYGFYYIKITKELMNKYHVTEEIAASQIQLLGEISGCIVYCLFQENDNKIRVRVRSNGPNINILAVNYSGGGHEKASGCKLKNWEEMNKFIIDVKKIIENYNNSKKEDV